MNHMKNVSKNGLIFNPFFLCPLFMEIFYQIKPYQALYPYND